MIAASAPYSSPHVPACTLRLSVRCFLALTEKSLFLEVPSTCRGVDAPYLELLLSDDLFNLIDQSYDLVGGGGGQLIPYQLLVDG